MTPQARPQLFHSLTYADARAGGAFLEALGFTQVLVVPNADDPAIVEHAQYRWRDNGGVMFGSVREADPHACASTVGQGRCYLVVATDAEVDATYERALAAGGASVQEPTDQDYGGRGATVTDPEGNQWSIGSYGGE